MFIIEDYTVTVEYRAVLLFRLSYSRSGPFLIDDLSPIL